MGLIVLISPLHEVWIKGHGSGGIGEPCRYTLYVCNSRLSPLYVAQYQMHNSKIHRKGSVDVVNKLYLESSVSNP